MGCRNQAGLRPAEYCRGSPTATIRERSSWAKAHLLKLPAEKVRETAAIVGLATDLLATRIGVLSGGQFQKALITFALLGDPNVLLVDEPTASLDAGYANDILGIFRDFHRVGVTVLVATHDESLIARFPGRMLRLDQGILAG